MLYGKQIRVRRAELGISGQELAEKCKTTKQTISKYENDKIKKPDYRLLKDIFAALGLDTNQFQKHIYKLEEEKSTKNVKEPSDDYIPYYTEEYIKLQESETEYKRNIILTELQELRKEHNDLLKKYIELLEQSKSKK